MQRYLVHFPTSWNFSTYRHSRENGNSAGMTIHEEIAYEKRMVNEQGAYYPTTEQRQMNVWQRYNGCPGGEGCYYVVRCVDTNGYAYI